MAKRTRKYEEINPIEILLLRESLGLNKFIKRGKRDRLKKEILLRIALKKIEEAEKDNFVKIGERIRKVKISK